jgi:CysZ protein
LFALILGFVPLIGPVLGVAVGGTATGLFLVLDAWSYPLDRRHMPLRAKIGYVRSNFALALGLGVGLFVMYLIPCAWFVVPPLAAVAGTRLYCELKMES